MSKRLIKNPIRGFGYINDPIIDPSPNARDASGGVLPVVVADESARWVISVEGTLPAPVGYVAAGDFIVWDGSVWTVIHMDGMILQEDISYDSLVALSEGNLIPGKRYRITDYATFDTIYGWLATFQGPVEPLTVLAIGPSQLSRVAYSAAYPQDIIYYDINNSQVNTLTGSHYQNSLPTGQGAITITGTNTFHVEFPEGFTPQCDANISIMVNDGMGAIYNYTINDYNVNFEFGVGAYYCDIIILQTINFGTSPSDVVIQLNVDVVTQQRPGLIAYRNDTIANISARCDWRNQMVRRSDLNGTYVWDISTVYPTDSVVTYIPGGTTNLQTYYCYNGSGFAGTSPDIDTDHWMMITDGTQNPFSWKFSGNGITYILNSAPLTLHGSFDFNMVNATLTNVHLGPNCRDILFMNDCRRITMGEDCYSVTFNGACQNLNIGAGCSNSIFADVNDSEIGTDTDGLVFAGINLNIKLGKGVASSYFGMQSQFSSIDDGSTSTYLVYGNVYCSIGKNCTLNRIDTDSSEVSIGDRSGHCLVEGNCNHVSMGTNCDSNHVEHDCSNITLGNNTNNNFVRLNCSIITIGDHGGHNTVSYDSSYITIGADSSLNEIYNACSKIHIGINSSSNTINSQSNYISIGDASNGNSFGSSNLHNSIGDQCGYNSFANSATYNKMGNGCGANSIGVNGQGIEFGNYCLSNAIHDYSSNVVFGNFCYSNVGSNVRVTAVRADNCSYNLINTIQHCNFSAQVQNLTIASKAVYFLNFEAGIYDFTGIAFTSSTLMEVAFSKTIFLRNGDYIKRMRYFDGNDNLVVTDPNT